MTNSGKIIELMRCIGAEVVNACQKGKTPFKILIARPDGNFMVTIRKVRKPRPNIRIRTIKRSKP